MAQDFSWRDQAGIADAYQAPDFHPGDTTDDSIYALGGITSDIYNLVNNVWSLKNLERMGYASAGVLGLVWTVEFFIYRFIHHQNEKTRQAGENTHLVTEAQTEVIRKLTEQDEAKTQEIKKLNQEIEQLKLDLQKERLNSTQQENRFKRLEQAVERLTGTSFPPLDDREEKVVSREIVSDGKELGGLDNSVDETREGYTSDIAAEMLRHTAGAANQASLNPQSFVAGGGRGGPGNGVVSTTTSSTINMSNSQEPVFVARNSRPGHFFKLKKY